MDIIIDELDGAIWAAAMDRNRLIGIEVDPPHERVRYGAIYWARVRRIDAGLDAAFVDLDGENTGLLYNRDVRLPTDHNAVTRGGNVGIGKLLTPGQFVLVQARSAYLPQDADEDVPALDKIPVVSMDIALHGRYLIGTPRAKESHISQRIREKTLRDQLANMLPNLSTTLPVILRKAAAHTQTDWLIRETQILETVWENVDRAGTGDRPHLLMSGPDAMQRALADHAIDRIDHIDLGAPNYATTTEQWCNIFAPDLVPKIRLAVSDDDNDDVDDPGLLAWRGVLDQIDTLLQSYVVLPGGGNIIIQPTAALTAIDVNAGPDRRGALALNLEAATEIARQIRLRNLGGMIVIDFLKMNAQAQREQISALLQSQFDDDPCTVHVHGFTKLGLMELTRARRTPTLAERLATLEEED